MHRDGKDIQDRTKLDKHMVPTVKLQIQGDYYNVSRMNGDIKGMQLIQNTPYLSERRSLMTGNNPAGNNLKKKSCFSCVVWFAQEAYQAVELQLPLVDGCSTAPKRLQPSISCSAGYTLDKFKPDFRSDRLPGSRGRGQRGLSRRCQS